MELLRLCGREMQLVWHLYLSSYLSGFNLSCFVYFSDSNLSCICMIPISLVFVFV